MIVKKQCSDKGFLCTYTRCHLWSLFRKEWSIYVLGGGMHASPLVFCHYSPDMLDQIIVKGSEVLFQKVEKSLFTDYCSLITVHGLLFTDYCSRITVHKSLFTFTVHDTVHSEILPI